MKCHRSEVHFPAVGYAAITISRERALEVVAVFGNLLQECFTDESGADQKDGERLDFDRKNVLVQGRSSPYPDPVSDDR